jgi:hypothetical protein
MLRDTPSIGPSLGKDNPLADLSRIPTERFDDRCRESPSTVGDGKQVVNVDQLRLELDEEEGLRGACQATRSTTPRSPK